MDSNLDRKARLMARKRGYRITRSIYHRVSTNNCGGFQILDDRNCVVMGLQLNMTAEQVNDWLQQETAKT